MTREEKNAKMVEDIINKMFEISGHSVTFEDVKDRNDAWYSEWTMTTAQSEEWRRWGEDYLKKTYRWNKKTCEKQMSWINLMWGLKYSDYGI